MPEIRTQSIKKTFPDGTQALHGIDLQVNDGELMALVGPSGCGKTTLLRIISGLEAPSGGKLFFDEKDVTNLPPNKRDLGMVFQNYALFPHLSIFRNISLSLENSPFSKTEKENIIQKVAESLGIEHLILRKPSEISGGQRQRVALARLLARNPSIHLLDEPLSNLDANLRIQMRKELADLHQEHRRTTLFVTHDQIEAMTLGQRICVLNQGNIEQVGTSREIYDSPENLFVARFFGIPSINLIHGSIKDYSNNNSRHFLCKNSSFRFQLPTFIESKSGDLILGIRPEKIQFTEENIENTFEIIHSEYHGDSQVCTLQSAGIEITCKLPSSKSFHGKKTGITIEWGSAIWFDPQNENRI